MATLGPQVDAERQRIRERFDAGTSARETLQALCEMADRNIQQVWAELQSGHETESQGLCLLALGGYGRKLLFPYSDLDILFLRILMNIAKTSSLWFLRRKSLLPSACKRRKKDMRCSRVTISGCRTVGPETVATAFGGSRRAETASDSSNRLASLSLGLSEPSAHRLATGDALHVLSANDVEL